MKKIRKVIAYKSYFQDFLLKQPQKVQNKIYKIIEAVEILERVPLNFLKHIEGTNGLYEVRINLASNTWRVFCFFDKGNLVILLNGFVKKKQNTPKEELNKAIKLMNDYFKENKQ